jgi:hypothetical protein
MRALCGAIITAGALIGLGLAAMGLGMRYQNFADRGPEGLVFLKFGELDTPLKLIISVLLVTVGIGLGIAFFGLALHHERRKLERMRDFGDYPATRGVPNVTPSQRVPPP